MEAMEPRVLFSGGAKGTLNGGPDPIEPDGYEPNNSFTAASNLGTTNTIDIGALTIHQAIDLDYFKFTAAANQTVAVRIDFSHVAGNLQLAAYNSAQQLIASSNTSTATNGHESVAISVTAGQLYYIKVSSVGSATSPNYDMTMSPLTVAFDWTMPPRFGNELDSWGLPIIPNTHDYAWPNPAIVDGSEKAQYGVKLDATGTNLGSNTVTYNWHITNPHLNLTRDLSTTNRVITTDLPEGQYTVSLSATANGNTLTTSKAVSVVDHLIVAMGDDFGSGEGNPNLAQQFDIFGFPTSGAKWAQSADADATDAHRRAHRSSYAGVVQAAIDLENSDPKSSVTFVFLDHTGATIDQGLTGSQWSVEGGSDPSQIAQADAIVGDQRIDDLILSVGANDAGFIDIARRLQQAEPGTAGYTDTINQIWADADANRAHLAEFGFPRLINALYTYSPLWLGQVFVTEIPDPTHDATGGTANKIMDDIQSPLEIDQNELNGFRAHVIDPLNQLLAKWARNDSFAFIKDISSAFNTHGYGDWIRTASDSALLQGPIGNRFTISSEEKMNTLGTLHPSGPGQDVIRQRDAAAFTMPNLVTTYFFLDQSAFLPGNYHGYDITVRNASVNAWAPASVARLYVSADSNVTTADVPVLDINIPALGPGEQFSYWGALPVINDPVRNYQDVDWVAPVLDVNNQVNEWSESDNVAAGDYDRQWTRPETDLANGPGNNYLIFNGPTLTIGQPYQGRLGTDEFIGAYDMDLYKINVSAGQRIAIDLDNFAPSNLDTYVRICALQANNELGVYMLAENDNGRAPDEGTTQNGESYLRYTFTNSGSYCIIVSHPVNAAIFPTWIANRNAGGQGDYAISVNNIPATPPAVQSATFDVATSPRKLRVVMTENVIDSIDPTDLEVVNLTTGQVAPTNPQSWTGSYDAATNTSTIDFKFGNTQLPDGNYVATIRSAGINDITGQQMAQDYTTNFYVLAADANRDRHVDDADRAILDANWGLSGRNFLQGDFNYDGTVNQADLDILNGNWHVWLPTQGVLDLPATSGNDNYRLRRESPTMLSINTGTAANDSPQYRVPVGCFPSISFNGGGGNDTLALDYSNGWIFPDGGTSLINFDGGAGTDVIGVLGKENTADSVTFAATSVSVIGAGSTGLSNVERATFDGRGGWDSLTISGGPPVEISTAQHLQSLFLAPATSASVAAGGGAVLVTRGLVLSSGSRLDLNDNDLVLDYSGASQLPAIQSLINAARANGAWTGNGLTSTLARSNASHNTTLGAIESGDFKSIYGNSALFDGEAIDTTAVLVKYTWYGDSDFNGKVNFDDYVRTDAGFNNHRTGWTNGDFDGNSTVNFDDYVLIDLAFNTQGGTL
jgi:hypothetical protein